VERGTGPISLRMRRKERKKSGGNRVKTPDKKPSRPRWREGGNRGMFRDREPRRKDHRDELSGRKNCLRSEGYLVCLESLRREGKYVAEMDVGSARRKRDQTDN